MWQKGRSPRGFGTLTAGAGARRTPAKFYFRIARLGPIMSPKDGEPHEAWGVLNPGGVRSADGTMHLFPRLIAEGNYSRIGHARVLFVDDTPVNVERLGITLEPQEPYEVGGGGVEDPRVVYIPLIDRYVMTYTAFIPYEPKIAVAVSKDLQTWERLGVLQYEMERSARATELVGNKDASFFPAAVLDPHGVPSLAILHRPTARVRIRLGDKELIMPPCGNDKRESIWISYVPVDAVMTNIANLVKVRRHERLMPPKESWEAIKLGGGAPPIRIAAGWLLTYHGVSNVDGHLKYSMGVAILDPDRPNRVLYRTPFPDPRAGDRIRTTRLDVDCRLSIRHRSAAERRTRCVLRGCRPGIAVARMRLPGEEQTSS